MTTTTPSPLAVWRDIAATVDDVARGAWNFASSGVATIAPWRLPAVVTAVARHPAPHLGTVVALHAAAHPDRGALVDARGTWTWKDLDRTARHCAEALYGLGARPGGRIAFVLPNCREAIVLVVAAARLGCAPVPVNPRFSVDELAHLFATQRPDVIVVDRGDGAALREAVSDVAVIERGDEWDAMLRSAAPVALPRRPGAGAASLVIHTSGTTGRPKGAERDLTQSDPVSLAGFLARMPIASRDTVLLPAPLFHALGLVGAALTIGFGARLVLQERFDPADACRLIVRHRVTAFVAVPVMLRRMLDAVDATPSLAPPGAFDALRWALVSGSALPPSLEARARDVFGPVVRNLYGSTEAGYVSIAVPDDAVARPGTVGRPLPGVHVRIVGDDGTEVPRGELGEIIVTSGSVFAGYTASGQEGAAGDAAGDAAAGVVGRHDGDTFHIGDMGWLDADGYLFVADRADDMVVTGGENVYPAEVERVLEAVDGVADCAVVGVADDEYGHVLVAYVVARAGSALDEAAVRQVVRSRIANFKVPKHVWFVDELPYNATGKVLRRQLRVDAAARRGADGPEET